MPRLAELGRSPAETKLLRRVLAHLPDWAEDEAAFVRMEQTDPETGEVDPARVSIRSYSLEEFTARMGEDPFSVVDEPPRPMSAAECAAGLQLLVGAGHATLADGRYRMTQAGRDELTAPEGADGQTPGPVFLDLAPAVAEARAEA